MKRLIIVLLLLLSGTSMAQVKITVVKTDGTTQELTLSTDGEIFISGDLMVVTTGTSDGTLSYNLDELRKVVFGDKLKINDVSNAAPLILFPSPTDGRFTVGGVEGTRQMTVYDARGAMVLQRECTDGDVVDISHLAQGIYLVRVGNSFAKIVKR